MPDDELAIALGKRFIQRRDVKAVQHENGVYTPHQTKDGQRFPWKMDDIRNHLSGSHTYGHYLVDQSNLTKLFAFDIDLVKGNEKNPLPGYWIDMREDQEVDLGVIPCDPRKIWQEPDHPAKQWLALQLKCCANALGLKAKRLFGDDIHIAMAYSGCKGLHVYGFFVEPVPATFARKSAIEVLRAFNRPDGLPGFEPIRGENFWASTQEEHHNYEIEIFPKQDSLDGKDLGNLMRLPLGINRKTGQRGYFIDGRSALYELRMMDPLAALSGELPWDEW